MTSGPQEEKGMSVLTFKTRVKKIAGRELDICDSCHLSAYVDEGRFTPATMPTPWRDGMSANFFCKACVESSK